MKLSDSFPSNSALPDEQERNTALEASRLLAPLLKGHRGLSVPIDNAEGEGQTVNIPPSAVGFLVNILSEMAKGNSVTLIPVHAELTTQEAANLLNVSRPFVIQLIKEGKLLAHKVGTHRRIRFSDLKEYKTRVDEERNSALDSLAEQAQELNMGY